MKLNTKLVLIMLTLLVIALLTLFVMNQYSQHKLVEEIQDSSSAISEVLQKSVEDLTSESDAEATKLSEYVEEAKKKGIDEINIIDNEGEIIDSSNPEKIGKQRDLKKLQKGFKAIPGAKGSKGVAGTIVKPYKLVVPVIIGDEQLGFVEINLLLDNIQEIQHENFIRRLVATFLVFVLGTAIIIFLARRYTDPIHRLAAGVKKVSAGDLSVIFPVESGDEIGELAVNFNEMVEKLRERESLEKRLYEAEHLSRVGQLASGIAHEIRNPLNYISLATDHLKNEVNVACEGSRPDLADLLDKIKEEVRRANYMVLNFMNYGRPLKIRPTEVSYSELVSRALPVLADKLDDQRIRIIADIARDLPPMWVDPELMRNCLFNFITNASQAMPDGGAITLGARFDQDKNLFVLTFADQGTGIAPEELDKIFQPYFTTKEAGIGLGLAITERIIREHGGNIAVASEPGTGTVFTVTLPGKGERPRPA
ncbi:sporulation kinase E [Geobacter sp. OR-1]|uniref:sensor histidine kinase n=1 Tax=Geobacter sp. OR-1 TaxID=1266765 RepID=UPI0005434599|nr:ATP-binding protein [Geobacter sp. OR-1]GAM08713.1 sporulation kinase E [Geobacter sp. OR-1]